MWNSLCKIIEPQIPNAIQVTDATSAGVDVQVFRKNTKQKRQSRN